MKDKKKVNIDWIPIIIFIIEIMIIAYIGIVVNTPIHPPHKTKIDLLNEYYMDKWDFFATNIYWYQKNSKEFSQKKLKFMIKLYRESLDKHDNVESDLKIENKNLVLDLKIRKGKKNYKYLHKFKLIP